MSLEHVQPGDRFKPRATTYNKFVDAARAHQGRNANGSPDGSARPWMISVQNDSDVQIMRFDAIKLGEPLMTDAANEVEFDRLAGFKASRPTDPESTGKMAIAQEPIAPNKIGRAIIFGVSPIRKIIVESESHDRARFGSDGEVVSSDDGPAVILWKSPGGQDTRRAVVAVMQGSASVGTRWARVLGSSGVQVDANRWDYSIEFVRPTAAGDWEVVPGTQVVAARNTVEASNEADGIQGNGVDATRLPEGFEIVPIGDGAIVRVTGPYGVIEGVEPGFWLFSVANLVDGDCE